MFDLSVNVTLFRQRKIFQRNNLQYIRASALKAIKSIDYVKFYLILTVGWLLLAVSMKSQFGQNFAETFAEVFPRISQLGLCILKHEKKMCFVLLFFLKTSS